MEKLDRIKETIGLELYANCILVQAGVRDAFLIQPADYDEAVSTDPKTAQKLAVIQAEFPELIQSVIHDETLISKKSFSEADVRKSADMGKILGYPCADEYAYTLSHPDEVKVGISIDVHMKPPLEELQILAYVCRDDSKFPQAERFAKACEQVLKADPLLSTVVKSVSATKTVHAPTKFYINKLLQNEQLTQDDRHEVENILWNLNLLNVSEYNYDLTNPVHRGMLIALLSIYDNDPMEPFFPLQYRPESDTVDAIYADWGNELKRIFDLPAKGGKRKTLRKNKRSHKHKN